MENTQRVESLPAGWVYGNFDGFPGRRIYPSWQGALEGKRLIMQDVRVFCGEYFIHSPWKNIAVAILGCNISTVEAYVLQHGETIEPGANVWD